MISRHDFLRTSLKAVLGTVAEAIDARLPDGIKRPPGMLYPPGAAEGFAEKCTACGDCVAVCPVHAIRTRSDACADKELAVIIPSQQACIMCEDLPCITACEEGVLAQPERTLFPRLGLAVMQEDVCLAYTGSQCMICFDACPLKRQAIQLRHGKPVIIDEQCTGCGICEQVCVLTTNRGVVVFPA